jgi:hypothetical protein
MTTRIMLVLVLVLALTIMIGPSLAYALSACMTESEAHAKFPKAHLYWHRGEHLRFSRHHFSKVHCCSNA